jgi:hypothetical protein
MVGNGTSGLVSGSRSDISLKHRPRDRGVELLVMVSVRITLHRSVLYWTENADSKQEVVPTTCHIPQPSDL